MKKTLISVLVALVLLWKACGLFAEGKGKGAGQTPRTTKALKQQRPEGVPKGARPAKAPDRANAANQASPKNTAKDRDAEKDAAKGKQHQQQLRAVERQMLHEETKHRQRRARLERIRELALGQGKTDIVERVDKLLRKEQQNYVRRQQKMQQARQKIRQLAEKALTEKAVEDARLKAAKARDRAVKARQKTQQQIEQAKDKTEAAQKDPERLDEAKSASDMAQEQEEQVKTPGSRKGSTKRPQSR